LRGAPPATDLKVLKRLADEPWVRDRTRHPAMVRRLWAACGIPDFRKLGLDPHTRFVERVFRHLTEGRGHVPHQWFADEIARLDTVSGDVETLAGRLAAIRSWAYIAQRPDWLADPAEWQARTRAIEERLSDGLHASLTQRFVDKRTTALIRKIGADAGALPVVVGPEGEVTVEDHPIGRLDGFRFSVEPGARASDKRLLLAAAEKRLGAERARRAAALIAAEDAAFALVDGEIRWTGHRVATLAPGGALARPRLVADRDLDCLDKPTRDKVAERVARWFAGVTRARVPVLVALADAARDPAATSAFRVVAAAVEAAGGILPRLPLHVALDALSPDERRRLRRIGVTVGALDLFDPRLLKPAAAAWRRALLAVRGPVGPPAREGATVLPRGDDGANVAGGYRPFGNQAVRVDLVERIARAAHEARAGAGRAPFVPDAALATSIGLEPATLARLMAELGFRPAGEAWVWRGRRPVRAAPAAPAKGGAFAGLAELFAAE
jgi:ATP-dependent RNA helicase SUPV3L1/SUV3